MVLSLLRKSDMYGYQLIQAIEQRSGGVITIQIGSLYPALYRLRDDGHISETQVPIGRRKFRVYYHLEPSGAALYQELLAERRAFEAAFEDVLFDPSDSEREGGDEA